MSFQLRIINSSQLLLTSPDSTIKDEKRLYNKKLKRQQTLLIAEQESSQCCRRAADLCLLWFAASTRAALGIFPEILLGTCCYRPLLIWKAGLCQCVFAWTLRGTNKLFLLLISLQFVNYLFIVCACASACECLCSSGSCRLPLDVRLRWIHHTAITLSFCFHTPHAAKMPISRKATTIQNSIHITDSETHEPKHRVIQKHEDRNQTQQYHTESDLIVE